MISRSALLALLVTILILTACTVGVTPTVDVQATVDMAVEATQTAQALGTTTAEAMAAEVQAAVDATLTAEAGTTSEATDASTEPPPTLTTTPTATTRPTNTPIPTSTPVAPPPTPSQAPDAVARAYFLAIADGVRTGDYRLAYSYKSSASQAKQSYATFRDGFRTTASVEIEMVRTTAVRLGTAEIYISVVAGDWTEGGGIRYRRFEYDYTLINENGVWRMDTAQITATDLSSEPNPDDDVLDVGTVDPVTAWNGLRLWQSPNGTIIEVLPANRQVAILSEPTESGGNRWFQVRDMVTGRTGWVMLQYLIFGPLDYNYYNLHWMPGCAPDRPEVEFLHLDQAVCTPGAEHWSLDPFADELRGLGMISASEWLEPLPNAGRPNWMIRVTNSSGATRGWIRIGTAVPLPNHPDPSLVGGVWRTQDGSNALVGQVCWLRMGYQWRCESN